jgi:hypothetical protein
MSCDQLSIPTTRPTARQLHNTASLCKACSKRQPTFTDSPLYPNLVTQLGLPPRNMFTEEKRNIKVTAKSPYS